jgi:hypothetical protein
VSADAGTIAARERVAFVLQRLERVELGVIVVAPPDRERVEARDRARDAAILAGRSGLLDEAAEAARATAMRTFARAGFSGTWAATEMSASVASAADRAAAAAAFEEAAIAAVAEDLVDEDTLALLRLTTDELARSSAVPAPGSLASLTARAGRPAPEGRGGVLLPTAVGVAVVAGVLVTGSVVGALAGGFLVAGISWLAGRRSRPAE